MNMKVLTIFLLAVAVCSGAKMSSQERAALEKRLQTAPFSNAPIQWDDGARSRTRIWNPFGWIMNLFKNKCECQGSSCNCCFKFSWINYSSCLNVEHVKSDKKIRVKISFGDETVGTQEIPLTRNNQYCGTLPAPLEFSDYCLNEDISQTDDGAISACFQLHLNIGQSVGADMRFKCFEIRDGRFTIGGQNQAVKNSMFSLRVKDPFKAAVQLYSFAKRNQGNQA